MHLDRLPARSLPAVSLAVLIACLGAACSGAAAPSASVVPSTSAPTAEGAVEAVVAIKPEFEGIEAFDPDLIGGCCWYTATAIDDGYEVVFRIGWGDCPAGCIEEHLWTYHVDADGSVELVAESGDPIPPDGIPTGG
jgi:hypothetical protein